MSEKYNVLSFSHEDTLLKTRGSKKRFIYKDFYYIVDDNKLVYDGFDPANSDDVLIYQEDSFYEDHLMIILNHCTCGDYGCGSMVACITINEDSVLWQIHEFNSDIIVESYRFELNQYNKVMKDIRNEAKKSYPDDYIFYFNNGSFNLGSEGTDEVLINSWNYYLRDKYNPPLCIEEIKTGKLFYFENNQRVYYSNFPPVKIVPLKPILNYKEFFAEKYPDVTIDKINFPFFKLFTNGSVSKVNDLIYNVIQKGKVIDTSSIQLNRDNLEEFTDFILVQHMEGEIGFEVIIKKLPANKFDFFSAFPYAKNSKKIKDGSYYPDEVDYFYKTSSATGLTTTDIYDHLLIFERFYHEDENHDDVKWNIYGFAIPDELSKDCKIFYNDNDGIDDIIPFRKIKVKMSKVKTLKYGELEFYKAFGEGALFPDSSIQDFTTKIPVYIVPSILNNVAELKDGKEMNVIVFGNISKKTRFFN